MKSIGQLAAGLAHEINTPIQYSIDNMGFLATAFPELIAAAKAAQDLLDAVKSGEVAQGLVEKIERILEKADLEYHGEEIPLAIQQSIDGENQVATIVQSMKEFSNPGEEKVLTDINHALENTITISRNEWKSVSEVISEFDTLPLVSCWPNEINQVFLNLIINATETIEKAIGKDPKTKGRIYIKTQNKGTFVHISIRDTGVGISNENQSRVFDPFFTTKEVGDGTGQGLYVSYSVIEKKHKGKLQCDSEPGKGSTFIVSLPV
jgi:two-component system NtrC family sensor kinase